MNNYNYAALFINYNFAALFLACYCVTVKVKFIVTTVEVQI